MLHKQVESIGFLLHRRDCHRHHRRGNLRRRMSRYRHHRMSLRCGKSCHRRNLRCGKSCRRRSHCFWCRSNYPNFPNRNAHRWNKIPGVRKRSRKCFYHRNGLCRSRCRR